MKTLTSRLPLSLLLMTYLWGCGSDSGDLFAPGNSATGGSSNGGAGGGEAGQAGANQAGSSNNAGTSQGGTGAGNTGGTGASAGSAGSSAGGSSAGTAGTGGTGGSAANGGMAGSGATGGTGGIAGSGGSAATAGTAGAAGTAGNAGTAGSAGVAGSGGTSGSAGTAGNAGSAGSAGQAVCGNNIAENGEECDGTDLASHDCTEFGFATAAGLTCVQCQINNSGCHAVCGNGTTEQGEDCDDGNTNDGDGCTKDCTNEITGADTCFSVPIIDLDYGTMTFGGSTVGGGQHEDAGCTSSGPDRVYRFKAKHDGFFTASLTRGPTDYDSVLYVSAGCTEQDPEQSVMCVDSWDASNQMGLNGGETVSFKIYKDEQYYVFVDGFSSQEAGNYQLVVDLSTGDDCNDPIPYPIWPGTTSIALGTTSQSNATTGGSCGGDNPQGRDVVYLFTWHGTGSVEFYTTPSETTFNSVIFARSVCTDTNSQIDCDNFVDPAGGDQLILDINSGESFYLWVDGSPANMNLPASGSYQLEITPQ